jgi:hypothetical protein
MRLPPSPPRLYRQHAMEIGIRDRLRNGITRGFEQLYGYEMDRQNEIKMERFIDEVHNRGMIHRDEFESVTRALDPRNGVICFCVTSEDHLMVVIRDD